MGAKARNRCSWAGSDPDYVRYHDEDWGVPVRRYRKLFEMLILEGAQAGLSWLTILRRREGYRLAFDRFDPQVVARYDKRRIERLFQRLKITDVDEAIEHLRRVMATIMVAINEGIPEGKIELSCEDGLFLGVHADRKIVITTFVDRDKLRPEQIGATA